MHDAFDHPHLELSASLRPVVIRHRGVGVGRIARSVGRADRWSDLSIVLTDEVPFANLVGLVNLQDMNSGGELTSKSADA